MGVECLAAASKDAFKALDIQGLVRSSDFGPVTHVRNPVLGDYVRLCTIVKASREEALSASGATSVLEALDWFMHKGAREVIVTMGRDGSLVATHDSLHDIPAYQVSDEIDTTGCGDVYLAAYVVNRVEGFCPEEAGHFASAVAGLAACARGVPPLTAGEAIKLVSGALATDIRPRLRRSHPGSNPEHSS
jgi:sugar/nucleoside kinase (ribokinase family)